MTTVIHPSTSGVVLAVTFTAAIVWVRMWLFRDRQAFAPVPQRQCPTEATRVVLVPVTDSPNAGHAVKLACLLAQERAAEILLAHVIVVPRSLPLDAFIAETETAARLALVKAREIVLPYHLPVRTVIRRVRDGTSGLLAVAQENCADVIVVGVEPSSAGADWSRMAERLAQRTPCEVIVHRTPALVQLTRR